MADLIDRQAAIDAVYKCDDIFAGDMPVMVVKADAYEALAQLPSAQPQRMRGEWIDVTKTGGAELWKCSECGELELEDSYFCPNCGADMRKQKLQYGDEDTSQGGLMSAT